MAELADAQDLGSCVHSCRFDPCYPHHNKRDAKSVPFVMVRVTGYRNCTAFSLAKKYNARG